MDEPVKVAQWKGQSLVHLQQKHGCHQDDNKIDANCDLEILLHSLNTLLYEMSDIEVLQVYLILEECDCYSLI